MIEGTEATKELMDLCYSCPGSALIFLEDRVQEILELVRGPKLTLAPRTAAEPFIRKHGTPSGSTTKPKAGAHGCNCTT